MSKPYLPPELLDHVVDNLQDTKDALEQRRTRELLLRFQVVGPADSKTPFRRCQVPNREGPSVMEKHVSGSPHLPCVLRSNFVHRIPSCWRSHRCRRGWLIPTRYTRPATSLILFHGFSPALKPPHLDFPAVLASDVFSPIYSFPLLEDLCVGVKCGFGGGYRKPATVESHPPPPVYRYPEALF